MNKKGSGVPFTIGEMFLMTIAIVIIVAFFVPAVREGLANILEFLGVGSTGAALCESETTPQIITADKLVDKETFLKYLSGAKDYAIKNHLWKSPDRYYSKACVVSVELDEPISANELDDVFKSESILPERFVSDKDGCNFGRIWTLFINSYGVGYCNNKNLFYGATDYTGKDAIVVRAENNPTLLGKGISHPSIFLWKLYDFCGYTPNVMITPNTIKYGMEGKTYKICEIKDDSGNVLKYPIYQGHIDTNTLITNLNYCRTYGKDAKYGEQELPEDELRTLCFGEFTYQPAQDITLEEIGELWKYGNNLLYSAYEKTATNWRDTRLLWFETLWFTWDNKPVKDINTKLNADKLYKIKFYKYRRAKGHNDVILDISETTEIPTPLPPLKVGLSGVLSKNNVAAFIDDATYFEFTMSNDLDSKIENVKIKVDSKEYPDCSWMDMDDKTKEVEVGAIDSKGTYKFSYDNFCDDTTKFEINIYASGYAQKTFSAECPKDGGTCTTTDITKTVAPTPQQEAPKTETPPAPMPEKTEQTTGLITFAPFTVEVQDKYKDLDKCKTTAECKSSIIKVTCDKLEKPVYVWAEYITENSIELGVNTEGSDGIPATLSLDKTKENSCDGTTLKYSPDDSKHICKTVSTWKENNLIYIKLTKPDQDKCTQWKAEKLV